MGKSKSGNLTQKAIDEGLLHVETQRPALKVVYKKDC